MKKVTFTFNLKKNLFVKFVPKKLQNKQEK